MLTQSRTATLPTPKKPGFGVDVAGSVLQWLEEQLNRMTTNRSLGYAELPDKKKYPHKYMLVEEFNEYSTHLAPDRFYPQWWKHCGGMVVPATGRNGQIHLYAIDDGLLSKSIPAVPFLTYLTRSAFIVNAVMGSSTTFQRFKSKIHVHFIDIADLEGDDMMAVKNKIAKEHESHGNYIPNASMFAFSLKSLCPSGLPVEGVPHLVRNDSYWFKSQIFSWRR